MTQGIKCNDLTITMPEKKLEIQLSFNTLADYEPCNVADIEQVVKDYVFKFVSYHFNLEDLALSLKQETAVTFERIGIFVKQITITENLHISSSKNSKKRVLPVWPS